MKAIDEQGIRRVLRIDSSARRDDSVSRALGDEVVRRLAALNPHLEVTGRDLARGLPHIDGAWVGASYTPAAQRDGGQQARLAVSDAAIAELRSADAVVMTVPIYNFSVPSVLKAWIDHICRAGVTFRYSADGPEGLLADRPVYLAMASGGVALGSAADHASGYLRQVLGFVGLRDVRLIGAERVASDPDAARRAAMRQLDRWLPAADAAA